jgi:hypothetical protein
VSLHGAGFALLRIWWCHRSRQAGERQLDRAAADWQACERVETARMGEAARQRALSLSLLVYGSW